MYSYLRLGMSLALLTTPAFAQYQFLTPFGTGQGVTGSSMTTVALGFNFTMPGGNVVTSVDVDSNGRIVEVGADTPDGSESTSEMLAESASIMCCWDSTGYTSDPNADLFFNTDNATVAWISWVNVSQAGVFTAQCQLYANGNIVMVYDSRLPLDDGHVGVSPGGGAADPGVSDLSTSVGAPIVTAAPVVYEDFALSGVGTYDLQSTALEFVPNGAGGANGWTVNGNVGVVDAMPDFAINELISGPCILFESFSLTFSPDGAGGYNVSKGPSAYDSNIGAALGLTSDDGFTGGGSNLDLGFAMPFPGGTSHQIVDIDPNGRILPDGAASSGDYTPSVADFTGDGHPMICPAWTDYNVNEPGSDDVYFNNVPGASATITWKLAQFDGNDASMILTHQTRLLLDGTIIITLEDLSAFNGPGTAANDDFLIGIGDGAAAPAETDYSALVGTANTGVSNYEFWDASAGAEPVDVLGDTPPTLSALTKPILGASWDFVISDSPAGATINGFLVGFQQQMVDLTPIGIPCELSVVDEFSWSTVPGGMFSVNIPNIPASVGLQPIVQGVTDGGSNPFLGILFTDAVRGTLGTL